MIAAYPPIAKRSSGQLQPILVRLIDGPGRVNEKRRTGLLNVTTENVGDGLVFGETNQPLRAALKLAEIVDARSR